MSCNSHRGGAGLEKVADHAILSTLVMKDCSKPWWHLLTTKVRAVSIEPIIWHCNNRPPENTVSRAFDSRDTLAWCERPTKTNHDHLQKCTWQQLTPSADRCVHFALACGGYWPTRVMVALWAVTLAFQMLSLHWSKPKSCIKALPYGFNILWSSAE